MYVYCSFKTIYLSENREHQYLNALKIQKKNTVIVSVATPVAREMCLDAYSVDRRENPCVNSKQSKTR